MDYYSLEVTLSTYSITLAIPLFVTAFVYFFYRRVQDGKSRS